MKILVVGCNGLLGENIINTAIVLLIQFGWMLIIGLPLAACLWLCALYMAQQLGFSQKGWDKIKDILRILSR